MKQQEVMAQILSEVTNKPVAYWIDFIEKIKHANPSARAGLEKELSQKEAEALMVQLRQEKQGILSWLVTGSVEAHKEIISRSN